MDFVADQLAEGRRFRSLTVVALSPMAMLPSASFLRSLARCESLLTDTWREVTEFMRTALLHGQWVLHRIRVPPIATKLYRQHWKMGIVNQADDNEKSGA
jgi:hypothetical protein